MNPFLFRRIRGPVFLLCFALTAVLAQWHILSFARSWPLYLIVAGLLRLLDALVSFSPLQQAFPGVPGYVPVRRGSFSFGLFEILFGVVFLLFTTDVLSFSSFWSVYSVWWPLLLVALGLLLLVERVFDRRVDRRYGAAAAYGRRRGGGGLVTLVVLLVILGLISRHSPYMHGHDWRGDRDWDFSDFPNFPSFNMGGETHENDVSLQAPVAADAVLTVDNAHGDLQIAPSTDKAIHLDAHQTAHVADRNKDSAFADTRPVLSVHGSSATVTVPGRNGVDVRLVLAVPDGVLCTVHNHHGDIAISGLRRALDVSQDHGDVTLDSIGGPVHVAMDHGDVHARALASDLTVDGRADDITISDVKGKTSLQGDFFGDTAVESVSGPVAFHSSRTQLDAQRVTGSLSLDSDDLRLSGVQDGLKIVTRSKDVNVTDLSGDARIEDSNSDIDVAAKQPLGTLSLMNSTGNVTLSVPAGASFSLNGRTGKDDEIDSDLPLAQIGGGGGKTVSGQVGQGGPHIEIRTDHGDLTLRHGSESPERPERPEAPAPPTHLRHLHSPPRPPAPPTVQ